MAIALYERRARMGGWCEEVYCSLLEVGLLKAEKTGDWPGAMDAFSRAWEARPQRLEACYELASRLRLQELHHTAHAMLGAAVGRQEPDDLLFTKPWVYRWGLLFEFSITAYWWATTRCPSARVTNSSACRTCPAPSVVRP